MRYPKSIQSLIDLFSRLPSVGPKTAERYVFYLLSQDPEMLQHLAQAIAELKEKTTVCASCRGFAEANPCHICADPKRQTGLLSVVADTKDMLAIESTGAYQGRYYVLGGLLDTIRGIGPDKLDFKSLVLKIEKEKAGEIILALDPNIEGETTSLYIAKLLKGKGVNITRLAKGLPSGAELEYADEATLTNAIKNRFSV
jgi:recombination protein RecR